MIDPNRETLMTIPAAARQLGRCVETLHAWRRRKLLDAVRLGGWWYTSAEALGRMARAGTEKAERVESIRSRTGRNRAHEQAVEQLRKMGVV